MNIYMYNESPLTQEGEGTSDINLTTHCRSI